jgi:hypothetical protein
VEGWWGLSKGMLKIGEGSVQGEGECCGEGEEEGE